jgi:DNA-binding response OmpR family regulator
MHPSEGANVQSSVIPIPADFLCYHFSLNHKPAHMRKKLLFISDCLDSCPLLIDTLRERFDVEWFCEGAEALLHLRTETPPNLVIVDPEIEGLADWELVRYLHSSKTCRGVPVIVISDRPFEENRHLYFRYGIMDYFRKPFLNEQLIDAVEGLLVADPLERIF